MFTFESIQNRTVNDFKRYEKRVLMDLANRNPGFKWDEKDEVLKTEMLFADGAIELQTQSIQNRVSDILRHGYCPSLDRVVQY